jgi:hypothetical protein
VHSAIGIFFCAALALGCEKKPAQEPPGSQGNPVTVCERFGDVCIIDGARLGVCSQKGQALSCMPQH